jgi:ubiquinone/menaquinone biosynthesis C-methylase UbiE
LENYYDRRAAEYEEVYARDDPVVQRELTRIATAVENSVSGRLVLEIACGTGYWTQLASHRARSIHAIDISSKMLEVAKRKRYECPVSFCRADAYNLPFRDGFFNAGLASFWFSHIPKDRIHAFLNSFHRKLEEKTPSDIVLADNVYVHGLGGELVSRPNDENTYKLRKLRDGSKHLVLKNYYSERMLREIFGRFVSPNDSDSVTVFYGTRLWCVSYRVQGPRLFCP